MAKNKDGDCYSCGEFHPDCSPCHQTLEDAALDRKQVLDAYRENMAETAEPYGEHRGSRALDADLVREAPAEPIDRMFKEAADAGFKPLTPEQAADFREKLRGASAALHGGRR